MALVVVLVVGVEEEAGAFFFFFFSGALGRENWKIDVGHLCGFVSFPPSLISDSCCEYDARKFLSVAMRSIPRCYVVQ